MNTLPSLSRDFDYGLFRPPLRASLESLDFTWDPELVEGQGAKHPVETRNKDFQFVRVLTNPKGS